MTRKRTAILISGRGTNMAALIEAANSPDYPAEIALVISNRPNALGLDRASAAGIATLVIDHTRFNKDRAAFDHALDTALRARGIEIVCLAGFMRLFTADFVLAWSGRMLNIHPSLLPSFPGLDPHGQALRAGVKLSGATVHFVTPETDAGPIVAQAAVSVFNGDTADDLASRILGVEHRIYPLALRLLAEDRLGVVDGRCHIDGARRTDAVLLAPEL